MFRPIYGECSYDVRNWLLPGWQVGHDLEIYFGRKRSWYNLGWYPDSCLERLRKNTKIINHNIWGPVRDLNVAPRDYGLETSVAIYKGADCSKLFSCSRNVCAYAAPKNVSLWRWQVFSNKGFSETFLGAGLNFLGAFAALRRATLSFVDICPSTWNSATTGRIRTTYTSYLRIVRKSVEKIQVLLTSGKNIGYFTWIHM